MRGRGPFSVSPPSIRPLVLSFTISLGGPNKQLSRTIACYEFHHLDTWSHQQFSDSTCGLFSCPWLWRKVMPDSFPNPPSPPVTSARPLSFPAALFPPHSLSCTLTCLQIEAAAASASQPRRLLAFDGNFIHQTSAGCLCSRYLSARLLASVCSRTPVLRPYSFLFEEWRAFLSLGTLILQQHVRPMTATSLQKRPLPELPHLTLFLPLWQVLRHSENQDQSLRWSPQNNGTTERKWSDIRLLKKWNTRLHAGCRNGW